MRWIGVKDIAPYHSKPHGVIQRMKDNGATYKVEQEYGYRRGMEEESLRWNAYIELDSAIEVYEKRVKAENMRHLLKYNNKYLEILRILDGQESS